MVGSLADHVDALTIQRDAAEARSRDLASDTVEALAILRAFVAAEDTQMVKAKGSGAAHLGFGMYSDAMDRARKLVGTP
jgi:acyl transferase domain-containing protein